MSNYVQTTFFTPKDSLPPTNPAKTIFGSAYDVEFGNIATAIATKLDASAGFVSSIAGTANQIAASASSGAVTLSLPVNVVIPTPASGNALTINGSVTTGASRGLKISAGTNASDFALFVTEQTATKQYMFLGGDGSGTLGLNSSSATILSWNATGNVTIAAPSSGNTLTLNLANAGGTNALAVIVAASASGNVFTATNTAGTVTADFLANGNFEIGTVSNTQFSIYQNNATRVSINSGVQIGAPAGGDQGVGTLNATGLYAQGGAVSLGSKVIVQASGTTRATTTLSNDAVYTYAVPAAGTYQFRLDSLITNGGVASASVVYNINYSGGQVVLGTYAGAGAFSATTPAGAGGLISTTVAGSVTNTTTGAIASSGSVGGTILGTLQASSAGTLAISWASSSTNSMNLNNGSLVVTRIA